MRPIVLSKKDFAMAFPQQLEVQQRKQQIYMSFAFCAVLPKAADVPLFHQISPTQISWAKNRRPSHFP